jgi:hydroxysqualene dehydroxylase
MTSEANVSTGRVHIIGAGVAGLSAATTLAEQGRRVVLYEAAPQAGGRCRSYFDSVMDRYIDNGNHLFLSGNTAINTYVDRVGSRAFITGPDRARFPFFNRETSQRWAVDAGNTLLPLSLMKAENRPPDTTVWNFLTARRLLSAPVGQTVASLLSRDVAMYRALWEPMAVAILNTPAYTASAPLLGAVLRQAFQDGAKSCLPRIAARGLSEVFVNPALRYLREQGADIGFNARLSELKYDDDRITSLHIGGKNIPLGDDDRVIMAVPPWVVSSLLPQIQVPESHCGIINGHFVLPRKADQLTIMGLINGVAQWIFVRGDVASVTISAVTNKNYGRMEDLAQQLWADICAALKIENTPLGAYRIITEKRATISHDPVNCALRPGSQTAWPNLVMAGDWTDTGLPATIEGAILSGGRAAMLV